MRLQGRVAIYTASGVLTPMGMHKIRCDAAMSISSDANAFVFDFTRTVLAASEPEMMAALGEFESSHMQQLSGAWAVPLVNLNECRSIALRLATYGIARRVFSASGPAISWAQEEAQLPRWRRQ